MAFAHMLKLLSMKKGGVTRDVFEHVHQISEVSVQFLYPYETGTLELSNINGHQIYTSATDDFPHALSTTTRTTSPATTCMAVFVYSSWVSQLDMDLAHCFSQERLSGETGDE